MYLPSVHFFRRTFLNGGVGVLTPQQWTGLLLVSLSVLISDRLDRPAFESDTQLVESVILQAPAPPVHDPNAFVLLPPEWQIEGYESVEEVRISQNLIGESSLEEKVQEKVPRVGRPALKNLKLKGTLENFLKTENILESAQVVEELEKLYDLKKLQEGQALALSVRDVQNKGLELLKLTLKPEPYLSLEIIRTSPGKYAGKTHSKEVIPGIRAVHGRVKGSFSSALKQNGVPASLVQPIINALSHTVDFQRDIKAEAPFSVVFESGAGKKGKKSNTPNVLFVQLQTSRGPVKIYPFEVDGTIKYFDEKGESAKSALLRTPIDGGRIGSGFGMRKHPVLGFTKMHTGVDFPAPHGSAIKAAGDGVVKKATRYGTYGNYILIQHNGEFSTAYAHLSKYAKGIKPGTRVKQGQVIGHVGCTGRCTGPHLHYEVIRHGRQVDPKSVKALGGGGLAGKQLVSFKKHRAELEKKLITLGVEVLKGESVGSKTPALGVPSKGKSKAQIKPKAKAKKTPAKKVKKALKAKARKRAA